MPLTATNTVADLNEMSACGMLTDVHTTGFVTGVETVPPKEDLHYTDA